MNLLDYKIWKIRTVFDSKISKSSVIRKILFIFAQSKKKWNAKIHCNLAAVYLVDHVSVNFKKDLINTSKVAVIYSGRGNSITMLHFYSYIFIYFFVCLSIIRNDPCCDWIFSSWRCFIISLWMLFFFLVVPYIDFSQM